MTRKKIILALMCIFMSPVLIQAQEKAPKKPSKMWYKPSKTETKEVKLESQNAISEKEITKFKWIITNKTKDFLVVHPKECFLKSASAEIAPNDKKTIMVRPLDNESKVIDATSTKEKSLYEFNIGFSAGGIYKSKDATPLDVPDFRIPVQQNVIEEGDFRIEHISSYTQSDVQWRVKLKITYVGTGLGIVEPRKISARTQTGTIIANNNDEKIFALQQGESENVVTVFKSIDPIFMLWNDTFKEAQLEKLDNILMDFEYDPDGGK